MSCSRMTKESFLWGKVPEGWNLVELQDVCTYISRGKQPKYVEKSNIKALNQKAVRWGFIDESVLKYHNEDIKVDDKHFIKENDVVINSTGTGTVGRVYHFKNTPKNLFADSHITIVRTDKNKLNSAFLMYQLSTKQYQNYIENAYLAGSTGQVEFNKSKVQRLPILLPPIEEQEKIAKILSSLDDKIELNNEMNKTLEEMAQSIFKRWFVDFEFPNEDGEPYKSSGGEMVESELGMIPRGWEVKNIEEVVKIVRGASPRPIQEYIRNAGIPWIKISDATQSNSKYINSTKEFIKEEGKSKSRFVKSGTLILSNSATPGIPKIVGIDACVHDGWLIFDEYKCITKEYMYCFLINERDNILNLSNGSVFRNLKTDILKTYKIVVPDKQTIGKVQTIFESINIKINNNVINNKSLKELRDILLVNLMNRHL